jgi:hypothetical protein
VVNSPNDPTDRAPGGGALSLRVARRRRRFASRHPAQEGVRKAPRTHSPREHDEAEERGHCRIPGGALLLDTPGIRELRVWTLDDGLDQAFPETHELAQGCLRACVSQRGKAFWSRSQTMRSWSGNWSALGRQLQRVDLSPRQSVRRALQPAARTGLPISVATPTSRTALPSAAGTKRLSLVKTSPSLVTATDTEDRVCKIRGVSPPEPVIPSRRRTRRGTGTGGVNIVNPISNPSLRDPSKPCDHVIAGTIRSVAPSG